MSDGLTSIRDWLGFVCLLFLSCIDYNIWWCDINWKLCFFLLWFLFLSLLVSITIPNCVTSIGYHDFHSCTLLYWIEDKPMLVTTAALIPAYGFISALLISPFTKPATMPLLHNIKRVTLTSSCGIFSWLKSLGNIHIQISIQKIMHWGLVTLLACFLLFIG